VLHGECDVMSNDVSKERMEQLGLGDLYAAMQPFNEVNSSLTPILWKGLPLRDGAVYRLQCEDEVHAKKELVNLSTNSDLVFIYTLNGWQLDVPPESSYYAEHTGVIEEIMDVHAKLGNRIFVVGPGVGLKSDVNISGHERLSAALERLRLITYSMRVLGCICIVLDVDMYEGKSDVRSVITRGTEKALK
jgi:hypothetical protein